jgi:uncharacterized membrane protein YccC
MAAMFKGLALRPARISWPYVGEVARSLLGVLLAIIAALHWGTGMGVPGAAIAAGGSAAIAGATALQDSPHGRLPLVIGVSLGMGTAVLIGSLTSAHSVVFVVTVTLWCLAAGMVWAVSGNAGVVAAAASALLVTCSPTASSSDAARAAALAVLGGLTQAVLVAAWPRQRWKEQRRALSGAYASVAAAARQLAADPSAVADPTPLIELREEFSVSERKGRHRPSSYRTMYALPERIAMTLNTLRGDASDPAVGDVLRASADVLEAVASHRRSAWADGQRDLRTVETFVDSLSGAVALRCRRLRAQITEAWALQFTFAAPTGRADDMRRPGFTGSVRAFVGEIRAQLSLDSPLARHALRLATAVGIGTAAARLIGLPQLYWIPLTVVLVLHPETAHTYTRCVRRVVGATAGVTAATAVMVLWHPDPAVATVLAVLSFGVMYAVAAMGHVPVSAALAVFIVFLIGTTGTIDSAGMSERIIAIVLGGGLAMASHVVLPDRSLVRLRQRGSELLKAEVEYAATVIRAFVHPLDNADDMLSWVWLRATRARSAFEASSGSLGADAPEVRKWLSSYRAALNAVTGACVTLEEQVATAGRDTLDPQFVVAVEDYVDALRGETPSQGQTWNVDARHLAEADQQLREAATLLGKHDAAQRVLVAETETITRHLLAVESLTA